MLKKLLKSILLLSLTILATTFCKAPGSDSSVKTYENVCETLTKKGEKACVSSEKACVWGPGQTPGSEACISKHGMPCDYFSKHNKLWCQTSSNDCKWIGSPDNMQCISIEKTPCSHYTTLGASVCERFGDKCWYDKEIEECVER